MVNFFSIARFFLFTTPFILVVVTTGTLFPYIVGKYFFFRLLAGLTFITFLAGVIFDRQRAEEYWSRFLKMIKSPLGIAVGVFTFIFVLSGFFGVDPAFSFWSNFERGEGGLQIIFLYIFFLMLTTLLKEEKDWRKYFALMAIAAFFVVFYGIGGALKHVDMEDGGILSELFSKFMGTPFGEISRFQGSLGNPAYLATYLLFAMFFSFYLLLSQRKAKSDNHEHSRKESAKKTKRSLSSFFNVSRNKAIVLMLSILFFAFFFFWAATRGAFIGLVAGGIAGAVYLFIVGKKWRVPIIAIVLLGAVLLGGAYIYQDEPLIKESRIARLFDISLDTETFRHRVIMWSMAIEGWKEKPLFGWGAENYHHIFYQQSNPDYYEFEEKGVSVLKT